MGKECSRPVGNSVDVAAQGFTCVPVPIGSRDLLDKILKEELDASYANETNTTVRFHRKLSLNTLRGAIDLLAARHPILKVRIEIRDGIPVFVLRNEKLPLQHHVVNEDDEVKALEKAKDLAHQLSWKKIDLLSEGVIRFFSISLAVEDHLIGFTIHHFVSDLSSVEIILAELLQEYDDLAGVGRSRCENPKVDYLNFLTVEENWLDGQRRLGYPELTKHCQTYLSDIRPTSLSVEMVGREAIHREAIRSFSVPYEVALRIRNLASSRRIPLSQVLLFSKALAIARLTGQTEITLYVVTSARAKSSLKRTVGCFVNDVLFHLSLNPDAVLSDGLASVASSLFKAFKANRYPIALVEQRLGDLGIVLPHPYAPMFNFVEMSKPAKLTKRNAETVAESFDTGPRPAGSMGDVATHFFRVVCADDGFHVRLRYSPLRYDERTVDQFEVEYRDVLQGFALNDN